MMEGKCKRTYGKRYFILHNQPSENPYKNSGLHFAK
jgi:hypothetical protein